MRLLYELTQRVYLTCTIIEEAKAFPELEITGITVEQRLMGESGLHTFTIRITAGNSSIAQAMSESEIVTGSMGLDNLMLHKIMFMLDSIRMQLLEDTLARHRRRHDPPATPPPEGESDA